MSERFRDVREEAQWLRLSEKTVRRHAAVLGAVKLGGRLLFPEEATLRYVEAQTLGPRRGRGPSSPNVLPIRKRKAPATTDANATTNRRHGHAPRPA